MIPALSVEARWCWISRTSQFHRRIRPGDSHASSPPRSALALGATQARGEGPDPVPGHHRSQRAPPQSPPSWTWSRFWRYHEPGWSARPCRNPGARSSQAARPLSRASLTSAGSRPSAPVMLTCPAPALLKQAIQSPSRAQLVDHIPTTSRHPVVIISSSHQCQSFHKGLHKPMSRLRPRAVAQCSALPTPGADEDLYVLDIHLRAASGCVGAGPAGGRPVPHPRLRKTSHSMGRSPYQRSPAPGCRR